MLFERLEIDQRNEMEIEKSVRSGKHTPKICWQKVNITICGKKLRNSPNFLCIMHSELSLQKKFKILIIIFGG